MCGILIAVEFGGNTSRSSTSAASLLSQSLASSDTRPSVIGRSSGPRHRGDGQDGSNTTSTAWIYFDFNQ